LKSFLPSILFWTGFTEKVEESASSQAKQVEMLRERLPAEYVPSKHGIEIVNTLQVLVAAMLALTDGKLVIPNAPKDTESSALFESTGFKVQSKNSEPEAGPEPQSPPPSVSGTAVSQGVSFSGCEQEPSLCSSVEVDLKLSRETEVVQDPVEAMASAIAELQPAQGETKVSPDLQLAWKKVEVLQEEIAAVMSEAIVTAPECLSRQPTLEAASHQYSQPVECDIATPRPEAHKGPDQSGPQPTSPLPEREAPTHTHVNSVSAERGNLASTSPSPEREAIADSRLASAARSPSSKDPRSVDDSMESAWEEYARHGRS
jgi:hypothetical protein